MRSLIVISLFILALVSIASAQNKPPKVFTSDIDNFWTAYDSIQTTKDTLKQWSFIQTLYIDKGTEGLKAFMQARDYSAALWVKLINEYPKYWASIRPNTLTVKSNAPEIERTIATFKTYYPELKEAKIYFTVGGLRSGGTTKGSSVLIGTEIATGNAHTDVSEFPDTWLAGIFKAQRLDNIVPLNIHEYVHTQQRGTPNNLLGEAIQEGSCDFIAELVMGKPMQTNYIQYGKTHEKTLKETFKAEMFSTDHRHWLYNGGYGKPVADLGYFMGYAICQSFYKNTVNKQAAIKQIITLNYSDNNAVEDFLKQAKYYTEPVNKEELVKAYEHKRPYVVKLSPVMNGDTAVDTTIKELKVVFSAPMDIDGYSINRGKKGKDHYPVTGITGFSADGYSFTVQVNLQPDHEYEFYLTENSFKSADDYPLKTYIVKFKTR